MKTFLFIIVCFLQIYSCPAIAGTNSNAVCILDLDYSTPEIESEQSINANSEIWIAVIAQDVQNLDGYQVEIVYDSKRMQFKSGIEDNSMAGITNLLKINGGTTVGFQAQEKSDGRINISNALAGNDINQAPEGSGIIAIIQFKVLDSQSDNTLTLSNVNFLNSQQENDNISMLKHAVINPFVNTPPQLSPVQNQVKLINQTIGPIALTISDNETQADALSLSAVSSNHTLISDENIIFSGSDKNREITITPESDQSGTAQITVFLSDGMNCITQTFLVTFNEAFQELKNTAIAAASDHSLALKQDGTVWAWGYNGYGQLGDSSTTNQKTPVMVKDLTEVTAIAAGFSHSLALKQDGTVWAWGDNAQGQLGDSSTTNQKTPVMVKDLTEVTAIAAGFSHSLALKQDGTVWAWGDNAQGQLGDSSTTNQKTPVMVKDLTEVTAIAAGSCHSFALKQNGTVWAWGYNMQGQLGNSSTTTQKTPVMVKDLTDVTAIAAGSYHSLALKQDGTVWAWGLNNYGQLGDSSTTNQKTPVMVKDLTEVTAIAAGGAHSLALKQDGTVWAWGRNNYGQLGDSSTTNQKTPVMVKDLTEVTAIAAGSSHSLALKQDGTVWAWGYNNYGQLGDSSTTNQKTPVIVKDLTEITAIAARYYHSLALKQDGTVWAWGWNSSGQLGDSSTTSQKAPVMVKDLTDVTTIAAGSNHSLALKQNGTVWAWGRNDSGQLGDSSTTNQKTPVMVKDLTEVTAIAAGSSHSLALKQDGTVWAWGYNYYGQPVMVKDLTEVTAIAAGGAHSLALKQDGTVWAWGYNYYGQLGDSSTTSQKTPVMVKDLTEVTVIAAGAHHSLALKQDGTVWAWGYNYYGQLGDSSTTNQKTPVMVKDLTKVTAIAAGNWRSLALKQDGIVWAWGRNNDGQLGDLSTTNQKTPVIVKDLTEVTDIAAGNYHSLALKQNGTVQAWGDSAYGQLGFNEKLWIPQQVVNPNGIGVLNLNKHYDTIWSGNPYNRMNFWISAITGYKPEPGDEIAIFDGNFCVGNAVINAEISKDNPLIISASQDDGRNNGFTSGHTITLKFWDSKENNEILLKPVFLNIETGKPENITTFAPNSDYGLELNAGYTITPVITDGGNISPAHPQLVQFEKSAVFTISPDTCNFIKALMIDGENVDIAKTYTFTNITENHTIKVIFGNSSPQISTLNEQTMTTPFQTVDFTISDDETASESLKLSVSSSNNTLLPSSNISLSGTGKQRSMTIYPADYLNGTSDITLAVSDGCKTTEKTFTIHLKTRTQTISIENGYNIISLNVNLFEKNWMSHVKSLINNHALYKILGQSGSSVLKVYGSWQNTIGDIDLSRGYQIFVTEDTEITFTGLNIESSEEIVLAKGWNIIGYPTEYSQTTQNILKNLMNDNQLEKVIGHRGSFLKVFGKWYDGLGHFIPGEGYQIKVANNCSMLINNEQLRKKSDMFSHSIQLFDLPKSTSKHYKPIWEGNPFNRMNFWIVQLDGFDYETGDEIGIFDQNECVGAGVIQASISQDSPLVITTSQDDGTENGFTDNNPITIKYWDSSHNKEIVYLTIEFEHIADGSPIPSPYVFKNTEDYGVRIKPRKPTIKDVINILQKLSGVHGQ
jgi:alpha-tubulin suppressor-like RCC1 family protein